MNLLTIPANWMAFLISLWPPFWFTGIKFHHISPDFRHISVQMRLHFYNKNMLGIQYGGNLFSMTDPCYIMMLMRNLGNRYNVLDQSGSIEFIKPGVSTVFADFHLGQADIDDIINKTKDGDKYFKEFAIDIKDQSGEVIAKVNRTLYIRLKRV